MKSTARIRSGKQQDPLEVVPRVDLKQYMGWWYEIARYPNRFERDCDGNATAFYTLRTDGSIEVLNRCLTREGRVKSTRGIARPAARGGPNTKLKVTFFWPFPGDYWITALDTTYSWAVVGEPNRKYLWILARTPEIEPSVYDRIEAIVRERGYNPGRLQKTPQLWPAQKRRAG